MKSNIKGGLIGVYLISVLLCNILILNGFSVGFLVFIVLHYITTLLLFRGLKEGWWLFVTIYGILSILGFTHLFIFGNITTYGVIFEILIVLGLAGLLKKDLRNNYLKALPRQM